MESPVNRKGAAKSAGKSKAAAAGRARRSADKLGPARLRHPPDIRRGLVVEAAAHVLAQDGLVAATARRVGQEAGVSIGTLTHHFAGMDELLAEALRVHSERFTADLATSVDDDRPAMTRLRELVDAVIPSRPAARKQWRLWFQFWARAVLAPPLAKLHTDRYATWRALVERLIASGVKRKELRKVDARAEALHLTALLDGLCLQVVIGDREITAEKATDIVMRSLADRLQPRG
jgi:DNA-binding transcriptional regulator YbjK